MVITSEYSTGMIRTSLTAQPRRGVVYAAKAIVFTSVTLVISLVTSFVAFFVGQALYCPARAWPPRCSTPSRSRPTRTEPGQPGPGNGPNCTRPSSAPTSSHPSTVLTAIIGTALFVTIVALIAFGVGSIIRHTAARSPP